VWLIWPCSDYRKLSLPNQGASSARSSYTKALGNRAREGRTSGEHRTLGARILVDRPAPQSFLGTPANAERCTGRGLSPRGDVARSHRRAVQAHSAAGGAPRACCSIGSPVRHCGARANHFTGRKCPSSLACRSSCHLVHLASGGQPPVYAQGSRDALGPDGHEAL
jgi:hypothetical protein